jgi:hypothetical protein
MTTRKRTSLDSLSLQPDEQVEESPPSDEKEVKKPSRPKTVQQTAYLPAPVHEQLRRLAFEERKKMHDYLMEGLDLVFEKRGLPSVDELKGTK